MAGNDEGTIELEEKVRGTENALIRLAKIVKEKAGNMIDKTLVISHADHPARADFFKKEIEKICNFKKIIVVKTGGLASVYANKGGIVVAFG